jgi:hypothetical protein
MYSTAITEFLICELLNQGFIDSWDADAARFSISFDAVGEKAMICTNRFFNTKKCLDCPPQNGHELTLEMVNAQKERIEQLKKAKVLEIDDVRYFCAAIWSKMYAKKFPAGFPYEGLQIENTYFKGEHIVLSYTYCEQI